MNSTDRENALHFNNETLTLLLSIEPQDSSLTNLQDLAQTIGLARKKEFHATLIGTKTGEAIAQILKGLKYQKRIDRISLITEWANLFDWNYTNSRDYHLISCPYEKGEVRTSLIQEIRLPDLAKFYKGLNKLLKTNLTLPFPHITLFTSSTNKSKKLRGIGIYSKRHFRTLKQIRIIA